MTCPDCGCETDTGEPRCLACSWRLLDVDDPPGVYVPGGLPRPVYDEAGEPFAPSVRAAAQRLGCTVGGIYTHLAADPETGVYWLVSRPGRPRALPVIYGERRWANMDVAALDLGVSRTAVFKYAQRDGDRAYILRRLPRSRK